MSKILDLPKEYAQTADKHTEKVFIIIRHGEMKITAIIPSSPLKCKICIIKDKKN